MCGSARCGVAARLASISSSGRPALDADERQAHRERRAVRLPAALGGHRAAVQLDEMADERQPQAEARVLARDVGGLLPEALEDVRQERRVDARAGVTDPQHRVVALRLERDTSTSSPASENLIEFESRFQATCCRRLESPETNAMPRGAWTSSVIRRASAAGLTASTADSTTTARSTGCMLEPHRAADHPRHVQQIVDELRLHARVAVDDVERLDLSCRVERAQPEHRDPAEDRVERRAQLVRDRRHELVLGAAERFGRAPGSLLALERGQRAAARRRAPPSYRERRPRYRGACRRRSG